MFAVNINPGAPPHGSVDQRREWVPNNGQGHQFAQNQDPLAQLGLYGLNANQLGQQDRPIPVAAPEPAVAKPAPLPNVAPQHTSINCCGIAQLTCIAAVKYGRAQIIVTDPKTGAQSYVETGVEEAVIQALKSGGFFFQTYKNNNYKQPYPATWDNTVGYTAAVMWTDAEYIGAGQVLAGLFVKKGYRVQCTDIGINPKYGTKEHFLRHWIAFTGPKANIGEQKARELSLTREYRYVDEQKQEPAKETVAPRNPSGYTAARVRKSGRVAGAGVRALRTGRPPRTLVR